MKMMYPFLIAVALLSAPFGLFADVSESILPAMNDIYNRDFGKRVNYKQKELMQHAIQRQDQKIRIMTYNMLYNVKRAEDKLPEKHRWDCRKPRLLEYLLYTNADIIGSQELQDDQLQEVINVLGVKYAYYGEKTRQNEERNDRNAIFFNKDRFELIDAKTIAYKDDHFQNAFTYCYLKDKRSQKKFAVLNTKLTWGNDARADRRLAEAIQLNQFSQQLSEKEPIIILGDCNTAPFVFPDIHPSMPLDGDYVEQALAGENLKDAKIKSIFGHFGPICSTTIAKETFAPFTGPQIFGLVEDHIFVNDRVEVFTHGIDTAKVNGEFPSDHFPVIADINFKED